VGGGGSAACATASSCATSADTSFFSILGGRSVVLCRPSVHGGMLRNSSKVRTRGLQHFHPERSQLPLTAMCRRYVWEALSSFLVIRTRCGSTGKLTFLTLMEDGRAWMVDANLIRVRVHLAAPLMHAFLRHDEEDCPERAPIRDFTLSCRIRGSCFYAFSVMPASSERTKKAVSLSAHGRLQEFGGSCELPLSKLRSFAGSAE
jgi:hypothetical protein